VKIRLSLGEADRKRYDCPEWIEFDPFTVTMAETIVMQRGADIDGVVVGFDEPGMWRNAMTKGDIGAFLITVWLGLRRAGAVVSLTDAATVEFDAVKYAVVSDDPAEDAPAEDAPGKDQPESSDPETTSS
jgi:hypothetical protein